MEILLLTGLSASGKSTIAQEINRTLGFEFIGERAVLHDLALLRDFARTREWLASDGTKVLLDAARTETIQRLKQFTPAAPGVIIDGCYDRYLPQALQQAFPGIRTTIIAVVVNDGLRVGRMMGRLGLSRNDALGEMELIDSFKKSAGVEDIIQAADMTIDNSLTLSQSVRQLLAELNVLNQANQNRVRQ